MAEEALALVARQRNKAGQCPQTLRIPEEMILRYSTAAIRAERGRALCRGQARPAIAERDG